MGDKIDASDAFNARRFRRGVAAEFFELPIDHPALDKLSVILTGAQMVIDSQSDQDCGSGGEGVGWIKTSERLPETGVPVLIAVLNEDGMWRRLRAMYAAEHSLEAHPDAESYSEYDEEAETFWCDPGWYEQNEFEETHWAVYGDVRYWMPLPPLPEEAEL